MQRLCMAWDAGSSPWDWDTETIFASNHGSGSSFRKASCNSKLGETIFSANGHGNPSQDTDNGRQVGHRTSTVHDSSAVSHAGNLHGYTTCVSSPVGFGNTMHGRSPAVTTCLPNGNFIDCNSDYGNGKSENLIPRAYDNQVSAEYGHMGFLKLSSQESSLGRLHYESVEDNRAKDIPNASVKPDPDGHIVSDASKKQNMEEQNSSTTSRSAGSGDSLTGLHLGKRTYSNDATAATMLTAATPQKAPQKPYSTTKKSRMGSGGSQIPRCQVEGCKADLSSCKDYHRRHKVCEPHSKSGKVIVASLEQRFCQQCSRFHVLSEFDEAKRSCRRRLAGHNERRRKPQPNPLALHARLQSDWSFLNQPRLSRLSLWQDPAELQLNGGWPRAALQLEDHPVYDYQVSGMSTKNLSSSLIHDKFPLLLLQSPKTMIQTDMPYTKVHQYLSSGNSIGNNLSLASLSSTSSSAGAEVLSGLETTPVTSLATRVPDSGRALSLLSLQTRSSHAPHLVSHEPSPSSLSSISTIDHEHTRESIVPSRWLLQGQQQPHQPHQPQQCQDLSVVQTSSSSGVQEVSFRISDNKDLHDYSYLHHSDRQSGFDNSATILTSMPFYRLDGTSGGRTV